MTHPGEVAAGERFRFGDNWARFLDHLTDERIARSAGALKAALRVDTLAGRSFLDVGSGSGLSSLAARRLGARVRSFDYDPRSVECTRRLRAAFHPDDPDWIVEEGSVLDVPFLRSLGSHDIVYSWGVLHHTGQMWTALENVLIPLASPGLLLVAIYDDAGPISAYWKHVKRAYNRLPRLLQPPFAVLAALQLEVPSLLVNLAALRPDRYLHYWTRYAETGRGMSRWHDIVDWVGGYPFEYARPEQIFELYRDRGLTLDHLKTADLGLGCNELVFRKA